MNKTFSFIIPVYNGAGVVEHALDSIYSQGLSLEDFEVICVDDCSPTLDTYNALNNYVYHDVHPNNLHVIRHTVNKRQGGQEIQHYFMREGGGFYIWIRMTIFWNTLC